MEILLITSRHSRRWIVPKGNLMRGRADHDAAAQEAFEEAGVLGTVSPHAIGTYSYLKQYALFSRQVTVSLFPLRVTGSAADWPEKGQRDLCWFAREAAAALVDEPELKRLIADFAPADLGQPR